MHSGRIEGTTRVLGSPTSWDSSNGKCVSLAIRDENTKAGRGMVSAWFPTPEELYRLTMGAPIYLTLVGDRHPPVSVSVGKVPT